MVDRDALLPHLIARRAEETPDAVVIQHVDGPELTYGGLHERNLQWAAAYQSIGVGAGQNVVTMLPPSFEAYSAWLGLSWVKGVEVPVNLMYRGPMLTYVINQSNADVLVVSAMFVERIAEVAAKLERRPTIVVPDAEQVDADLDGLTVVAGASFFAADDPGELDGPELFDIACIIYTSGTTGPSKGVLVPWGQMHHSALSPPEDALREGDGYYSFWPPFHMSGKYALYLPAARGARMVMRPVFSPSHFWDDVKMFDVRYCVLVLPMLLMVAAQPANEEHLDNPLYGITSGPITDATFQFAERYGLKVATGFGMTEVGGPIASEGWDMSRPASCGKVRADDPPGYEVRIVDEHDIPLPAGEVGELIIRTREPWALNAGYYNMPEKTAEAWRNGWFHTGDGFKQDSDGYLYFVDRIKDYIRRRGENISSFEVEALVNSHPEVVETAAFGVPSELGEDEVKVCVVRAEGSELTEAALIEHLIPVMPRFMIPRYVEFVDALPKTDATQRTKKVELKRDPLNERTWDREQAGIQLPK